MRDLSNIECSLISGAEWNYSRIAVGISVPIGMAVNGLLFAQITGLLLVGAAVSQPIIVGSMLLTGVIGAGVGAVAAPMITRTCIDFVME